MIDPSIFFGTLIRVPLALCFALFFPYLPSFDTRKPLEKDGDVEKE